MAIEGPVQVGHATLDQHTAEVIARSRSWVASSADWLERSEARVEAACRDIAERAREGANEPAR